MALCKTPFSKLCTYQYFWCSWQARFSTTGSVFRHLFACLSTSLFIDISLLGASFSWIRTLSFSARHSVNVGVKLLLYNQWAITVAHYTSLRNSCYSFAACRSENCIRAFLRPCQLPVLYMLLCVHWALLLSVWCSLSNFRSHFVAVDSSLPFRYVLSSVVSQNWSFCHHLSWTSLACSLPLVL